MSDSDEIISSDERDTGSFNSFGASEKSAGRVKSLPVEDLTIEDSDVNSDTDDSLVVRKRRSNKKRVAIIASDSDENDEEEDDDDFERRALSPRTRMSITGIRPADLTDESSEIEYSDDEQANAHNASSANDTQSSQRGQQNSSNTYETAEQSQSSEEASKANSFLQQTASEHEASLHSGEDSDAADGADSSEADETQHVASSPVAANNKRAESNTQSTDSPLMAARYSTHFENAIKEKLSSTIYQPNADTTAANDAVTGSDDSDIQIINKSREKTIEIFSSDDEQPVGAIVMQPAQPTGLKQTQLLQPKITNAMPPPSSSKRRTATPAKIQYVSKDFHAKELRKLEELKMEALNAETLYEKISKNLPDGGKQLRLRIERLRHDMQIKAKYVASLKIEDVGMQSAALVAPQERKPFFNQNAPDWDELSAAVNQMQPVHTGKQGLATFNTQKALTVERLKEMHVSLDKRPAENVLAEDPAGLKVQLMDHQKHALAWMAWREKQRPHGGILADDMGLGKTLTMISMVLAAKNNDEAADENADPAEANNDSDSDNDAPNAKVWTTKGRRDFYPGGTLVVCPASLIRQWEGEVQSKLSRHKLTVCVHHGNNRDTKPKHLRTYDIVVTTYQIVAREHKSHGALYGIKWRRIILDEAHVVRNHKAQSSMAVCELRGRNRWALTGTPIQNKEMDVYAILKFLKCSPFDDLAHWKKWIDNKSAGGQMRLNTLMQSLMLRRTKQQLQERGELQCLPAKEIKLIEVELDKEEMNVYQKIMIYSRTLFAQFLMQRAERTTDNMYRDEGVKPTFMQTKDPNDAYYKVHQKFTKMHQGGKEQIKSHQILVLLLRLRQICCHAGLIDAMLEDDDSQHVEMESDATQPEIDLLEQLNKLAIKDSSGSSLLGNSMDDDIVRPEEQIIAKASARVLQRSNPVFNLRRPSTKMLKVLDTIKRCVLQSDDKAIIVSQWTSVLNILRTHLEEQGIATLSLNGQIAVKNRQEIVTDFNNAQSRKRVLLLSLTAGGVGLNLVGANHLLLIDLHWNPQLEAQAQDRIYRVGQKKNVIIYKFMCKDTVEERIRALQEQKLEIANGVLTGVKGTAGTKLTIDDLKGLFGM